MADLRTEPNVQDSTEYVDDNGVTRQNRDAPRRTVPPTVRAVPMKWVGTKPQKRRRALLATGQGDHMDVNVPPPPDPDQPAEEDDGDIVQDLHTNGTTYHFAKNQPVDVHPDHVEFLEKHYFHKIVRHESAEDRERRLEREHPTAEQAADRLEHAASHPGRERTATTGDTPPKPFVPIEEDVDRVEKDATTAAAPTKGRAKGSANES